MKISEYNQMMAHLTRPKDSSSTANINNKPINKISSGVKALAKSKAMAKRIREPKVRNVDFKLGDPVAYVNEIKEVYQDNPPDVYEINNNLNKYRSANDQRLLNYVEPILDRLKVKGKRTQTPIQKKSVAREILKSFKPIELGNDYYKNFQEIKEIQRQSKVSEQRFNEAMKKPNDPDESGGIAYLLGLNQKGEL